MPSQVERGTDTRVMDNVTRLYKIPYFFDQTPQLLFYFAAHFVQLLFKGGYYSRAAFISLESPEMAE